MNDETFLSVADIYMERHLRFESWERADMQKRLAALTMAQSDVENLLFPLPADPDDRNLLAAICEQALFLLDNYNAIALNKVVTAESIDGVGSANYSQVGSTAGKKRLVSERTMEIIDRIIGGAANSIGRG